MGFRTPLLAAIATSLALTLTLPTSARARDGEGNLLLTSVAYTVYVAILNPAGTAFGTTAGAGLVTTTSALAANLGARQMLMATLEDAAHYFETGEATGILPQAIQRVRESNAEVEKATDSEIVNAIVDAAYRSVGAMSDGPTQ